MFVAATATGADAVWTGGTSAAWSTTTNWNPGTPTSGDVAVFDGAGGGNTTIDLGGDVTAAGLRFTTGSAGAYTIGSAGQSLGFSGPGDVVAVTADVTTAQTLAADVVLGAAGTFTARNDGSGLLSLTGSITGSSAGTAVLAVTGAGDTTLSGAVTTTGGNVSLVKQGSGTLALSGGGTFAGSGAVDPAGFAASVVLQEGVTVVSGGSYDASGTNLTVGGFVAAGAEGTNVSLQVEAGSVISGVNGFNIGRGNGTGVVSSDVVLNGDAAISAVTGTFGFNSGSLLNQPRTSLVLNDFSTLTLSGKFITVGRSSGANSTLTVNDSAVVDMTYAVTSSEDGGGFAVGGYGSTGSLLVNGGTVRATWLDVARGDNNTQTSLGTVTVTNGGLLSSQGNVRLGHAGNGLTQAVVTIDGGTLSVGTTSERWVILGRYDATNSSVAVQNGGRLDLNGNSDIRFTQNSNTGTNVFTLTDGTVTGYADNGQTPTGNSVVDLNYGSTASGTNNTFNLDGGTLTIRRVVTSNNSGRATFNFNGGLLRANGPIASLVDLGGTNQRALVRDGGARVDTNGFDVTLPEALRHSDIDGDAAIDGGLTKLGAGTLTLTGLSTYTGDTSVEAGAISVTTAVSLGSGGLSLADAAAFNLTVAGAIDTQFTTSSLTLGASSLAIDLAGFGNPSLAPLAVGGNVAVGGATTIDFATLTPAPGTIPLISYGSLSGFANLSLGTLPLGMTASLVNNTAASTIDLVVASLALPRWNGDLSGVWDVGGTANWIDSVTSQPVTFTNGEPARFDDQATGTTTVSIPGTVLPGSVTVANESLPYVFGGAGGIGGSGGLTKSGAADLTISNVNNFTGPVQIEGGRLLVQTLGNGGVAGPLGASSATASNLVLAGGTLVYGGGTATSDRGFRGLAGTSAFEVSDPAATLTLTGSTAGGGGEVAKTGPGTLVLAASTNTLPETRVVSGTLALTGPGATADSQTTRIEGSLWAGAALDQAATLAVTNATLSIRDYLQVGLGTGTTGVTSTASFTNSAVTTGNLQLGYDNLIVGNFGTQQLTLVDSTLANAGNTNIGYSDGSTAAVTLSGTSAMTSGSRTQLGLTAQASGSLVIEDDASYQTGGWLAIGNSGTGSVAVRGNGRLTSTGDFNVADQLGSTGSLEISDNATVAAAATYVGKGTGSIGTVTMTGGSFTGGNNNSFYVGTYGNGSWTQSGGEVTATGAVVLGRYGNGYGRLTISGGTFSHTSTDGLFQVGREGRGEMVLSAGDLNLAGAGGLAIGSTSSGSGTVALDGGVLTARRLQGGAGFSSLTINGGTIRAGAGASGGTFMNGIGLATIQAGGVTIDSNGQDLVIAQTLSSDGMGGGLTKVGAGVLTLSGQNSYTGMTTVTEGGLAIDTATFATGGYDFASGTSFDVAVVGYLGSQVSAATVTLGGLNTLGFDLGDFGNPVAAPLSVAGSLASMGTITIDVATERPQLGQFPLVRYGSLAGTGTFQLGSLPAGVTGQLVNNTAGNSLDILITALASRQWNGLAAGLTAGVWDVGTTANWVVPPSDPSVFANGDEAVFNDLAQGTTAVVLNSSVTPNGVVINNEFLAYSFSGSGQIAGPAGLLKRGAGQAEISTANTFTGGVRIEGGSLAVPTLGNGGTAGPLGSAPAAAANLVLDGGTLAYTGTSATSDRGFTVAAAGGAIDVTTSGAVLTLTGATAGTTGQFSKAGPGTLALAADATTLPEVRVAAGTLALAGPGTTADSQTTQVEGSVWAGTPGDQNATLSVINSTLTIRDHLQLGRGSGTNGAVSTATFTNSVVTNRILQLGYDGGVAGYLATQQLTLENSTLTASGNTNIAYSTGSTATVTLSGNSALTSATRTLLGLAAGASGTLVIEDDASFQTAGWLAIGNSGTGAVIVRDNGRLSLTGDFNVADLQGSTGTLEITGAATVATGAVYVGKSANATGTVTMSGGSLEAGVDANFQVGQYGTGSWTQTGGTVNANGWTSIARYEGSTGSMTISGGTFNQTASNRGFFVGEVGTGTLTVSGTGVLNVAAGTTGLTIGKAATAVSTVNLDGGRITTTIVREANEAQSIVNFNGGVLQAAANAQVGFMTGLDAAYVMAGGAIIDSNGNAITIEQPLLDGGSGGGLSKIGTGTLTLSGVSTYTGATSITAGTLSLTGDLSASAATAETAGTLAGSGTVGSLAVNVGGTVSPGVGVGALTTTQGVTWASGGSLNWQIADAAGSAGTGWDLLTVGGTLSLGSTAAEPFAVNLWSLSSADPLTEGDAANFDAAQAYTWTIASTTSGITGFAADKFVVRTAAANGTSGFTNIVGTGSFAVAQSGNDLQLVYSPGAPTRDITIDVPSGSETQAQAGYPTISTADSVTKIGAGTVVFDAANAYTGPTTISAGTLQVANADGLAATAVTVDSGATLAVASGTTMKSPSVIVDGGTLSATTLAVNNANGITSLAINAGTISGAPVVTISSAGQMSLVQDARVTVAIGGLSVDQAGGGRLDLGAGQVSVAAGGITAADLRADIIAGRNGGAWNGTSGIMSSTAAAAPGGTRAVGYFIAGDGTTRVSFAAPGDGDLSGQVNVFDLLGIDSAGKFGTGQPSVWSQGDFNYDGVTNIFDLLAIDTAGAYGAGNYFPAAPTTSLSRSVAAVPEPGCLLLLAGGLAAAGAAFRRRGPCTGR